MGRLSIYGGSRRIFGMLGDHLPSFVHVFAFSLLTAGVAGLNRVNLFLVCLFWFMADTLFEAGQAFPQKASALCPEWFKSVPYLENTGPFFKNGTFDMWDIVSFAAGAYCAWVLLKVLKERNRGHDLTLEKKHP